MIIGRIAGATRVLGKSQGYLGLPLRDVKVNDSVNGIDTCAMETAWEPTPGEMEKLNAGAPVILRVLGRSHPPVMLEVGETPDGLQPPNRGCCLTSPDPGPWTAGVDDSADPEMIGRMHAIRAKLSNKMPIWDFIWALEASVGVDNRTRMGRDIQRCLLSNAAHRLKVLAQQIDPRYYATPRDRLRDAWAVWKGRAVVTYVKE